MLIRTARVSRSRPPVLSPQKRDRKILVNLSFGNAELKGINSETSRAPESPVELSVINSPSIKGHLLITRFRGRGRIVGRSRRAASSSPPSASIEGEC